MKCFHGQGCQQLSPLFCRSIIKFNQVTRKAFVIRADEEISFVIIKEHTQTPRKAHDAKQ